MFDPGCHSPPALFPHSADMAWTQSTQKLLISCALVSWSRASNVPLHHQIRRVRSSQMTVAILTSVSFDKFFGLFLDQKPIRARCDSMNLLMHSLRYATRNDMTKHRRLQTTGGMRCVTALLTKLQLTAFVAYRGSFVLMQVLHLLHVTGGVVYTHVLATCWIYNQDLLLSKKRARPGQQERHV